MSSVSAAVRAVFGPLFQGGLSLKSEWQSNYRYHGGVRALARCLLGSIRLQLARPITPLQSTTGVDCVTFSVVPHMTALWSQFIFRAVDARPLRVIIGDCSGGLQNYPWLHSDAQALPLFNAPHGAKLDLLMHKVCRSEYVIVSDDDVFWLDEVPFRWAIDRMRKDPNIAVVSLYPRSATKKILQGKLVQAIGSYSLVIRRDTWIREGLSFKIVRPPTPPGEDHRDWYYDTVDYANVQLIERGYTVLFAPPEIRSHLVEIEGVSHWILKARKRNGDIAHLLDTPFLQEKVFRAILFAEGLTDLISSLYSQINNHTPMVESAILNQSKRSCARLLGYEEVVRIEGEVAEHLLRIRNSAFVQESVTNEQVT